MEESVVLDKLEFDEPVGRWSLDEETPRPQKIAKQSPLHEHFVAPLSFLVDAVNSGNSFNITSTRKPFGNNLEAYVRPCYERILQFILQTRKACIKKRNQNHLHRRSTLFIIRGSSGIGKSTFLAYFVGRARSGRRFSNIALFHSSKFSKTKMGDPILSETECYVVLNGETVVEGYYGSVQNQLEKYFPNIDLIIMDGCSMPFDTCKFKGTLVVAGTPSLYVKNLINSIFDHYVLTMPPLLDQEALEMGSMLGVDESVVRENLEHMTGITRYLFEPGFAKRKVLEAVEEVNTFRITGMIFENRDVVHSLVLWKVGNDFTATPSFELVSRYAARLVAQKLCLESAATLKSARQDMAPLSVAEGYAEALFEAYAIRTIQAGCTLDMRSLEDGRTVKTLCIPPFSSDRIIVEHNDLTETVVPYDDVRVSDPESGQFSTRLLWPTTANFPTFDCFYFHTTGEVFPLQMTIARVHDLKNSGCAKTKLYFDGMLGSRRPKQYPAVFVVPTDIASRFTKQKFTGPVNEKNADYAPFFEQWVVGV